MAWEPCMTCRPLSHTVNRFVLHFFFFFCFAQAAALANSRSWKAWVPSYHGPLPMLCSPSHNHLTPSGYLHPPSPFWSQCRHQCLRKALSPYISLDRIRSSALCCLSNLTFPWEYLPHIEILHLCNYYINVCLPHWIIWCMRQEQCLFYSRCST